MKQGFFRIFVLSLIGLSLASFVLAQDAADRDRRAANAASSIYVVSAKAGGINFVAGKVAVARTDGKSGYLVKGDELEIGDRVSTGADGKVEILLNPGSYVRLGENTEFEFLTTSLDDLRVSVKRGNAIFEVLADNEFRVAVAAPKADFYLIKSGVYRVDVPGDGTSRLEVWRGRAQVGDGQSELLKNGLSAIVGASGQTTIAKFDRDDKDSLEMWSKDRAKELAKINSRLNRRDLRSSLMSSSRGWSIYDAFGLWVYDPFSRTRCFLPFGFGWKTPYGYYYGRDLWDMQLPWIYYNPPVRNQQQQSPIQPGPANANMTARQGRSRSDIDSAASERETTARTPRSVPPFMNIQRDVHIDRGPVRNDGPMMPASAPPAIIGFPTSAPPADTMTAKPRRGN